MGPIELSLVHRISVDVTDGVSEVVEYGTALTDAFGIPGKPDVKQTAILIARLLHQKLIDEQLFFDSGPP